jgi:hypothetical protein
MEDIRSIYFFKKQEEAKNEKDQNLLTLLEADLEYKLRNSKKMDSHKESLLVINIFIASQGILECEREIIKNLIRTENDNLIQENIYLKPILWELTDKGNSAQRKQDEFNNKLLNSEIVIFLTWESIGHYTKEEFEIAYESMMKGNKPFRMYIFNKTISRQIADLSTEDIQAYRDIKVLLRKEEKMIVDYAEKRELEKEIKYLFDFITKERQLLLQ